MCHLNSVSNLIYLCTLHGTRGTGFPFERGIDLIWALRTSNVCHPHTQTQNYTKHSHLSLLVYVAFIRQARLACSCSCSLVIYDTHWQLVSVCLFNKCWPWLSRWWETQVPVYVCKTVNAAHWGYNKAEVTHMHKAWSFSVDPLLCIHQLDLAASAPIGSMQRPTTINRTHTSCGSGLLSSFFLRMVYIQTHCMI